MFPTVNTRTRAEDIVRRRVERSIAVSVVVASHRRHLPFAVSTFSGISAGLLGAMRDREALASALLELAEPGRAARMGAAGRRRMSDRFTLGAVADRILAELDRRLL